MGQPDRESVYSAFLAFLIASVGPIGGGGNGTFQTVQRRFLTVSNAVMANSPYLLQIQSGEKITTVKGLPSVRVFSVHLLMYSFFGAEGSVVPDIAMNALVTAVEGALAVAPATGFQQLVSQGITVSSVVINGEIEYANSAGSSGTWGMALIPVEIVATY